HGEFLVTYWCSLSPIASSRARTSSGNLNSTAARFSRRWPSDEVPGIRRMLGARVQEPGGSCLHCSRADPGCELRKRRGLERREAAKREKANIGDTAARQFVDQRIVVAMGEIVVVLHINSVSCCGIEASTCLLGFKSKNRSFRKRRRT